MLRATEEQSGAEGARAGDREAGAAGPHEDLSGIHSALNFLVTNRIPRRALTRFMAWFSAIEQPVVRDLSIGALRLFAGDLNLHEARQTEFRSLRDCFTRELKAGARPIDRTGTIVVSPCDAIVGAFGRVD